MKDLDTSYFNLTTEKLPVAGGSLIVAQPFLSDEWFGRAVISLIDCAPADGATGVVLNNRMDCTLREVLDGVRAPRRRRTRLLRRPAEPRPPLLHPHPRPRHHTRRPPLRPRPLHRRRILPRRRLRQRGLPRRGLPALLHRLQRLDRRPAARRDAGRHLGPGGRAARRLLAARRSGRRLLARRRAPHGAPLPLLARHPARRPRQLSAGNVKERCGGRLSRDFFVSLSILFYLM